MDKTQMRFALDAHVRGWHIFPCEPGTKEPALLYPGTHRPGRVWWPKVATNDLNQIIAWWTERPDYNIGVACKPSGLIVIDCDVPKTWEATEDGWDQFQDLCSRRAVDWMDTIDTYQVETPSKGVHLYYWCPPGVAATQSKLASLVDVRGTKGEGGYVVGAGSINHAAGWYHCINPAPVKMAPTWLVEAVSSKPVTNLSEPFTPAHPISDVGLHDKVRSAPEGRRNDLLFWAVAQHAEENPHLTEEDVFDSFVDEAVEAGLPLHEIRGTVGSAYRRAHHR